MTQRNNRGRQQPQPSRPNGPSMLSPGDGPNSGQDGDWGIYTNFQQRIYEPAYREINDRFKYANLEDEDRKQLVAMLADLGDMQLHAPCNQFTLRSKALHEERDAIVAVLEDVAMPVQRPEFDANGNLVQLVPNPDYIDPKEVESMPDDDDEEPEDAEASVEADGGDEDADDLEDEDPDEPQYTEAANGQLVLLDVDGNPEFLDFLPMGVDEAIDIDRTMLAEEGTKAVWYVPNTPGQCYDRMDSIDGELKTLNENRAKALRGGYFYDSGELLEELMMSPDERRQGDVSHLYPEFYRKCFREAAITAEDLHGHLQAVNADQVLERHGGNFMNPKGMSQWGNQGPPPPHS